MHLTQIMFESDLENKDFLLEKALKKHVNDATAAPGYISHDVWLNETKDKFTFSLNIKWQKDQDFLNYHRESHKDRHHKDLPKDIKIEKRLYHFNQILED